MILELIEKEIEQVVSFHTADENERNWNVEEIYEAAGTIFPLKTEDRINLSGIQGEAGNKAQDAVARTKIINYLVDLSKNAYKKLEERIGNPELMRYLEKGTMLRTLDTLWVEHLENMDSLRTGIGLRGYGQRDPLVEYKKESYRMFMELMNMIQMQIVYSIYKMGIARDMAVTLTSQPKEIKLSAPAKTMKNSGGQFGGDQDSRSRQSIIISKPKTASGKKVGRNDPCPCGSGKKYKKCCGK